MISMEVFRLTCRTLAQLEMPDASYIKIAHFNIKRGNRQKAPGQILFWSSSALTLAKWLTFSDKLVSLFFTGLIFKRKKKTLQKQNYEELSTANPGMHSKKGPWHGPFCLTFKALQGLTSFFLPLLSRVQKG